MHECDGSTQADAVHCEQPAVGGTQDGRLWTKWSCKAANDHFHPLINEE